MVGEKIKAELVVLRAPPGLKGTVASLDSTRHLSASATGDESRWQAMQLRSCWLKTRLVTPS
jgi:hypothetical protein